MLRRIQVLIVLGAWVVATTAAAQDLAGEPTSDDWGDESAEAEPTSDDWDDAPAAAEEPAAEAPPSEPEPEPEPEPEAEVKAEASVSAEVTLPSPAVPASETPKTRPASAEPVGSASDTTLKLGGLHKGWETGVTGYFRAPLTIGFSKRPGPDDMNGPARRQLSYGPNRVVDSNYYSFAYTRLQEQDWMEVAIYARKKHVEGAVGWMGYWYQGMGFRNPDAGWMPGIARLTLDTDIELGSIKPNVALTGGAWWPRFGYHTKYDTYTLGLFRHLGEQVRLTIPFTSELTLTLTQGFGTGRDGSYNYQIGEAPKIYGAETGLNLVHYEHLRIAYREWVDVGLHFNKQWTRDPNLYPQEFGEKTYSAVRKSGLSVIGGEASVSIPRAGRLWVSPSYLRVKNGWALAENGIEVMHGLGGAGIATNYMGFGGSVVHSTGTGKMLNLGFLYENTLSGILGKARGSMIPDLTVSGFGLMALATLDLPTGSLVTQDEIKQFKWGADAEVHLQEWLGLMVRYDSVNYDLDNPGYIFSAITARLNFSSHFLSGERIYLQYSRYFYGDNMTIAGKWPWGQPLVAGSDIIQGGPYTDWKPDADVVKIQAEIAF